MAEQHIQPKALAFAGYASIAGAVSMLIGAAFWGASGTDLWQALADGDMDTYLGQLPEVKSLLVINSCFWILGVLLMATAGTLMARLCISHVGLAQMAGVLMRTGASIGIVSFVTMLSLAIVIPSVEAATLSGWIGARLDDIATFLIIGFGPFCLSVAGRGEWVPGWLMVWGYLAGAAALLGVIGMLTGVVVLGFIIVPFGIGWMIAGGVVLLRKSKVVGLG